MGALGDEMHRAIRLVVDVAIHTKNMSRERYKIGAMKIRELRTRYEKELGAKFNLAEFHNQVLKDGSLPLSVFESKMDASAKTIAQM